MADGPALKLVHCTLTCGPIALSNHPLALPTMACAWVMLGNAPTRRAACALAEAVNANHIRVTVGHLVTRTASDHHGKDASRFLLLFLFPGVPLGLASGRWFDN